MNGLTEGRIVHFVLDGGPNENQHRPAIVVRVWQNGVCNLQVFPDGTNDGDPYAPGIAWRTSIMNDEETKQPGTWHWIEHTYPDNA